MPSDGNDSDLRLVLYGIVSCRGDAVATVVSKKTAAIRKKGINYWAGRRGCSQKVLLQ
jgi:hypothetical protein